MNYIRKRLFSFSSVAFVILLNCQHVSPPIQTNSPKKEQTVLVITTTEIISSHKDFCPDDMVYITDHNYCIDKYEAPNKEGEYPFYAKNAYDGVAWCQSQSKDLCSEEQWHTACVGPDNKRYSYSNTYIPHACNDDQTGWIMPPWETIGTPVWDQWCKENNKSEPSGNRKSCVSDYGVFDLVGNSAEWVRSKTGNGGFEFVGGFWYNYIGNVNSCSTAVKTHSPGFNSYELSFRCCTASK